MYAIRYTGAEAGPAQVPEEREQDGAHVSACHMLQKREKKARPAQVPEEREQESGEVARLRPPGSPCSLGPALAGGAAAAGSPARGGAPGLEAGPGEGAAPNLERRSASLERLSRSLSQARGASAAGRAQPSRISGTRC